MHLTNILNDFLSLGKLEEGKIEVNREALQLAPFFHEIEEEIKLTLKAGQRIDVQCEPGLAALRTDGRILRNVLFNLISNASKYSPENKPIHLVCRLAGSQVQFSVRDEGIGIPDDDKKHIFERFFRATNAGNIQGTGLGLNIVKRYAELLGGNISFESTYGKGSTFTLSLPNQPS
jgi:signal transduction histidine kinase